MMAIFTPGKAVMMIPDVVLVPVHMFGIMNMLPASYLVSLLKEKGRLSLEWLPIPMA